MCVRVCVCGCESMCVCVLLCCFGARVCVGVCLFASVCVCVYRFAFVSERLQAPVSSLNSELA